MKFFILLLPLVYARARLKYDGISISIKHGPTEASTTVKHEGEDVKTITDSDAEAFNLTKGNLQKAVEEYSGAKPTDVFTKNPTPWDDLKAYKWREVKRDFKVKHIKLVNVTEEEPILSKEEFNNNETDIKTLKESIFEDYETFVSRHYWSGNEKVSARVSYVLTKPYGPPLFYGYESKVGQHYIESGINIMLSYRKSNAQFNLEPNQTANFLVIGTKVTARVLVEYETNLSGDLAVNYSNKHDGRNVWVYDVNEVLTAANMTTTVATSEYVEVKYLADYKTQIVDALSGKDIEFVEFDDK